MALPTFNNEWFDLTGAAGAAEKIRRFNAAGTTIEELAAITDPDTITWMLANGYSPPPAYSNEIPTYGPTYVANDGTRFYSAYDRDFYEANQAAAAQGAAPVNVLSNEAINRAVEETNTRLQTEKRIENLANQLNIPQFMIASLVNQGMSDADIRAKYTATPEIAEKLIEAAMSTGVNANAPVNFNTYGGHDRVLEEYLKSGQPLSLASLSPTELKDAAAKINETGVGSLNALALAGVPISQTALDKMAANGVDAATIAQVAKDYSPENIKSLQAQTVADTIKSVPDPTKTDLFSEYYDYLNKQRDLNKGTDFKTGISYSPNMATTRTGVGVDVAGESGIREAYLPFVERLLERASAEAAVPFQKYTGTSPLLESAKAGIANLTTPAQFLQGSNLAQAAGIGALNYGKYQPTAFTTGTFSTPRTALAGPSIDPNALKTLSSSTDPNAKAKFYRDYMGQANQALLNATNQVAGQQSPEDWAFLQNLAGFNFIDPNALKTLSSSTDPNAKANFYRDYMGKANQALLNVTNQVAGQQSPEDWTALQKLAGFNFSQPTPAAQGGLMSVANYDAGGAVFDPQQALAARAAESPSYNTTGVSRVATLGDPSTFDWSKVGPINLAHGSAGGTTADTSMPNFTPHGPIDMQVGVFGPGGTMYSTPQAAQRAGVTNYTYEPPNNTAATNPNLQPVNYGGQNVTNVQASYMSPYMQGVIDPAVQEAKRQAQIANQTIGAKAAQAGAFGGSRHGLMESELQRNLATQIGGLQSKGLQEAYTQGLGQFNTEQDRSLAAQKLAEQSRQFGAELGLKGLQTGIQAGTALGDIGYRQSLSDLATLKQMADLGTADRTFDYNEFLRGEKYPYENLTFMKNILGAVPNAALSPAAEGTPAVPGGSSDAFNTFLQALEGLSKIVPGNARGGMISGIATLGD